MPRAAGLLKIGISLGTLNPRVWKEATQTADRLGFESVWLPEHLVLPVSMSGSPMHGSDHPPIRPDTPVFDPFVYMAMLAGCTERVRFGTQVFNIGLRHPFTTARAVATLDVVSQGRVELGIGASWLQAEWRAAGLDFSSRGSRVDEAIEICRRLWIESEVEHHGRHFDFDPVMFEPKPVQSPLPMHIGGDGPAAIRRAALLGDGWIPMNHTLDEIPASLARIRAQREAAGRDPHVEITLGLPVSSRADLEGYAGAGVTRVLVKPWQSSREAIGAMERFANDYPEYLQ
ncbi:MAG TPA: LLM class F420-dependent oxidoreductase [Acidimicrobiales bacterium]|nr:LLM class F420-dependent oxidoreductase [Acidimicrobiales bacterium]